MTLRLLVGILTLVSSAAVGCTRPHYTARNQDGTGYSTGSYATGSYTTGSYTTGELAADSFTTLP
jgi:hypothetical protein